MKRIRNNHGVLALMLCVTLILSLLAGCGSSGSSNTESASVASANPGTVSAPESVVEAPADDQTDTEAAPENLPRIGNAPESIATTDPSVYPIETSETLSVWSKETIEPLRMTLLGIETQNELDWVQSAEASTGIHIDWTIESPEIINEHFNIMVASGELPDIICDGFSSYYNGGNEAAYEADLIMELSDLMDAYAPNYLYYISNSDSDVQRATFSASGDRYSFERFNENELVDLGLTVRGDMAENLGFDVSDMTTVDEIHDFLLAAKDEYNLTEAFRLNSSGQLCTAIVSAYGTPGYEAGSSAGGEHNHIYQVDGVVQSALTQDGYRDYLAEMNQWYKEGLISSDFVSTMQGFAHLFIDTSAVIDGDSAVFYSNYNMNQDYLQQEPGEGFRAVAIPTPTLNKNETTHFTSMPKLKGNDTAISADCANPELAVRWLDWWYSSDGYYLHNYGVEGIHYEWGEDNKPHYNEYITDAQEKLGLSPTGLHSAVVPQENLMVGIMDMMYLEDILDDARLYDLETYAKNCDDAYLLPNTMTLTAADNERIHEILNDIEVYASECALRFITGEMDIDTQWDSFCSHIEGMNLDEAVEIYQATYDQYIS